MYEKFVKRILDIVLSLVAMPFVLIICLILVPIIKHDDPGPAFYNAPRVGKDRVEFKMYQFRSMKVNSPDLKMPDGSTYNGPDDPRMTKVGAFIRRTSLDEVPQFFNVLIGNMSLIGPRPDVWDEVNLYEGREGDKLKVKPGITGYAQVYGRNSIPWKQRLQLDLYYVDNISFKLDVKIFFKTIASVFKEEGIYNEPESVESTEEGDDAE